MIGVSLFFSVALSPFAILAAIANGSIRFKNKEPHIQERLGLWGKIPKNIIWLHGASVGECLSLRPLLTLLQNKKKPVLLTTTTATAHAIMSKIHPLVRHQIWDAFPIVLWRVWRTRPSVYITVESEIWPVLLWVLYLFNTPIMLLNARLSERSMKRWQMFPNLARSVFSTISYATTTCEKKAFFLKKMGVCEVEYQPHLKYMSAPLHVNQTKLNKYSQTMQGRSLWLAASIHLAEKKEIIHTIKQSHFNTIAILAPRHLQTIPEWCRNLTESGLKGIKQSDINGHLAADIRYIIIDKMGELPLFYSLCPIVFVGGNLVPGIGGHNIIEPSMFGCAVIWGPYTDSCQDVCLDLAEQGFPLSQPGDLAFTVQKLLKHPELAYKKGQAIKEKLLKQQAALHAWGETWIERISSTSETR